MNAAGTLPRKFRKIENIYNATPGYWKRCIVDRKEQTLPTSYFKLFFNIKLSICWHLHRNTYIINIGAACTHKVP